MTGPATPRPAQPPHHHPRADVRTVRAAALDCGTNTVRLLVADVTVDADGTPAGLTELTRQMVITRLGQGVDRTGELDPAALARTLAAVRGYAATCRELGVPTQNIRFVATSATRDARNREDFAQGVRRELGVAPEVASGDEEAALSFAGAASVLGAEHPAPVLVVDIGGGSTELVLGTPGRGVEALFSADVGSVRMTERHLHSDPPTAAEVAAARADVRAALDRAARVVPIGQARAVIGLAGSVTTLTAHALGLDSYDRARVDGAVLGLTEFRASCAAMIRAPRAERAAMGFLHPGRVDVIAAGAVVWDEVLRRVSEATAAAGHPVTTATTSEHDILDGIVLAAAAGHP